MKNVTMDYSEYKQDWHNLKTVNGSYDKQANTVTVMVPDVLADLAKVIPAEEIEAYRAELVESGNSEYAYKSRILSLFADDLRGASVSDFEPAAWIEKAIEIVNK